MVLASCLAFADGVWVFAWRARLFAAYHSTARVAPLRFTGGGAAVGGRGGILDRLGSKGCRQGARVGRGAVCVLTRAWQPRAVPLAISTTTPKI